ncbi:LacI family DNA-binding transcriptional regulator [Tessaracoccus flavus]|uniref:Uncharacterized protein n=1 Tax=Tessaracoccus flavus TaxID=1610493 RepID=A0A1Q2CGX6_9ACTN|nr:LacI family DNA-binding transcriptional regulator [Tessaracoccus flavus]AQP45378.1 hypothetical protein RPIT_11690 [Tessaracoccus flavus]SDY93685.1 transcriptional regulator, LacI family [Tessaracoccus flavus]
MDRPRGSTTKKPTLKNVAELAGVSPMTASRVVAGGDGVSPAMVRRVQAAVKTLGYSRNEAARLMRPGQRSGLLGVIITNIDNPYYAQVLLGIESAAQEAGRLIITGISHNDPRLEAQLVKDLVARQIEGLIVVPASTDAPHLSRAAAAGMPIVLASRSIDQGGVDTVLVDDIDGVRAVLSDKLRQGEHPMAFIGGPDSIATAARRYRGFALAHADAGLDIRPDLVERLPAEREPVMAATRRLLDLDQPPRAFFTTNNRYTVHVLRVLLQERNRWATWEDRPPLVGFDSFELADLVPYPLTLIEHDARAMGRIAGELALRRIDHRDSTPPMTTTLPSVGVVVGQRE